MPRCEKCGYPRATATWCTSCSSTNPYPIRKWALRLALALAVVGILVAATVVATKVASDRLSRERSQGASFRMER